MSKTKIRVENRSLIQRGLRRVVEMIGRIEPVDSFLKQISASYDFYSSVSSVDYSKVNYDLTRAIYLASEVEGDDGNTYGADFLLGAPLAKPIVNAAASFVIGDPPVISYEGDDIEEQINDFLKDNKGILHSLIRNSYRDGDSYVYITEEGSLIRYRPQDVTKIVSNINANIVIGYDIELSPSSDGQDEDEEEGEKSDKKYKIIIKVRKGYTTTEEVEGDSVTETNRRTYSEDSPLPMVHFANEREANAVYGQSDYQSCYTLFANYHAVLESAIKNNIYNSTPVPILMGIKDFDEFENRNFDEDSEGNKKMSWDNDSILMGGEGFEAKMMNVDSTAGDAKDILNTLFWLICQTSETPEFVFGTAVQSSKASVSEQMPVMIQKVTRKRSDAEGGIRELIVAWMFHSEGKAVETDELTLSWKKVSGVDMKIMIEAVKLMIEQGAITDQTMIKLLGLEDDIDDIEEEVKEANAQASKKAKELDIYGAAIEKSDKEAEEKTEEKPKEETEKVE